MGNKTPGPKKPVLRLFPFERAVHQHFLELLLDG